MNSGHSMSNTDFFVHVNNTRKFQSFKTIFEVAAIAMLWNENSLKTTQQEEKNTWFSNPLIQSSNIYISHFSILESYKSIVIIFFVISVPSESSI